MHTENQDQHSLIRIKTFIRFVSFDMSHGHYTEHIESWVRSCPSIGVSYFTLPIPLATIHVTWNVMHEQHILQLSISRT